MKLGRWAFNILNGLSVLLIYALSGVAGGVATGTLVSLVGFLLIRAAVWITGNDNYMFWTWGLMPIGSCAAIAGFFSGLVFCGYLLPKQWPGSFSSLVLPPAGLCPRCDYDLRATPERCPECGTAASGLPADESGTNPP